MGRDDTPTGTDFSVTTMHQLPNVLPELFVPGVVKQSEGGHEDGERVEALVAVA